MATDRIEQRARDLRAVIGEHTEGPLGEDVFSALVCDRCGVVLGATTTDMLIRLATRWQIGENLGDPDFCPVCADG